MSVDEERAPADGEGEHALVLVHPGVYIPERTNNYRDIK